MSSKLLQLCSLNETGGLASLNTVLLYHPLHPCLTQACHQGASGNGRESAAADESRQGTLLIWHTWSVPVVHSKIASLVQLSTQYSQGGQRPAVLRTGYTDPDPDHFCYRPYASVIVPQSLGTDFVNSATSTLPPTSNKISQCPRSIWRFL